MLVELGVEGRVLASVGQWAQPVCFVWVTRLCYQAAQKLVQHLWWVVSLCGF